jgi:hypothetical protein
MRDHDHSDDETDPDVDGQSLVPVGYKRPPVHTRFKPGQSGNPTGRARGSKNLKTPFRQILNEQVFLRQGQVVRKVSKAEAVLRGLVVGALKGDQRNVLTLFRLAGPDRSIPGQPRCDHKHHQDHRRYGCATE